MIPCFFVANASNVFVCSAGVSVLFLCFNFIYLIVFETCGSHVTPASCCKCSHRHDYISYVSLCDVFESTGKAVCVRLM